jgi:hypothetical protein
MDFGMCGNFESMLPLGWSLVNRWATGAEHRIEIEGPNGHITNGLNVGYRNVFIKGRGNNWDEAEHMIIERLAWLGEISPEAWFDYNSRREFKKLFDSSEVKEYRKRPIVIKAVELKKDMTVPTLEGDMDGHAGDFLIKGIAGEIYPCKRDIFLKTYEAVVKDDIPSNAKADVVAEFIARRMKGSGGVY